MEVGVITESKGLESYIISLKSHCRVAEGVSRKENPQLARLRTLGLRGGGMRMGPGKWSLYVFRMRLACSKMSVSNCFVE